MKVSKPGALWGSVSGRGIAGAEALSGRVLGVIKGARNPVGREQSEAWTRGENGREAKQCVLEAALSSTY